MQSWFIPQDMLKGEARQAFEKWPIGLSEQKKSLGHRKAQELGAMEDHGLTIDQLSKRTLSVFRQDTIGLADL